MRIYNCVFVLYSWEFMLDMLLAEKFYVKGYAFWKMEIVYLVPLVVAGIGLEIFFKWVDKVLFGPGEAPQAGKIIPVRN